MTGRRPIFDVCPPQREIRFCWRCGEAITAKPGHDKPRIFCSNECYMRAVKTPEYQSWRIGTTPQVLAAEYAAQPNISAIAERYKCSFHVVERVLRAIGIRIMSRKTLPAAERFWMKVRRSEECWEWQGYKDSRGYGFFCAGPDDRGPAHRFSYRLNVGEIPDGLVIDHMCNNPSCVRPDHLQATTQRVNNLRSETGTAASNSRKLFCKRGHPLTGDNLYTYEGRYGTIRNCLTCRRNAGHAQGAAG